MRRREFIAALGGVATAWPLAARAQQTMPVIGFLRSSSLADATTLIDAFRQGLRETGHVEGQNVVIEYRSANNDPDRLTALATDLVNQPVCRKRPCGARSQDRDDDGADRLRDRD